MLIDLDIHELWYLLEGCLRGSHLRSDTIERFTNEFYEKLSEHQRMNLFEWAVRLGYAWNKDERHFTPSPQCCDADIVFMKRFHPLNQYNVTACNGVDTVTVRAFKKGDKYFIKCNTYVDNNHIVKVEHIDLSEQWEKYKQHNVDYDTNILE